MTPIDLVGCRRCGIVARWDSEIAETGHCPECGARLGEVPIEEARAMVGARRRAEQRRHDENKVAEVGLDQSIREV
jgi:uncharacterized protein with PIN domain